MNSSRANCYGTLFPPISRLTPNADMAGKVFSYRVEHHGVVPQAPAVHIDSEAWHRCTQCPDFDGCYRLSFGTLLLSCALRT